MTDKMDLNSFGWRFKVFDPTQRHRDTRGREWLVRHSEVAFFRLVLVLLREVELGEGDGVAYFSALSPSRELDRDEREFLSIIRRFEFEAENPRLNGETINEEILRLRRLASEISARRKDNRCAELVLERLCQRIPSPWGEHEHEVPLGDALENIAAYLKSPLFRMAAELYESFTTAFLGARRITEDLDIPVRNGSDRAGHRQSRQLCERVLWEAQRGVGYEEILETTRKEALHGVELLRARWEHFVREAPGIFGRRPDDADLKAMLAEGEQAIERAVSEILGAIDAFELDIQMLEMG